MADDELMVRAKIISTKPKYNPYSPNDVETAWIQPIAKGQVPSVNPNVIPLPNAHAHNDYEQSRPLWDALSHGFTSIEADVYLINDTLFVSHERPTFNNPAQTLENLYLKPLMAHIQQNQQQVYAGYKGLFYLMIDFKTEAESTYKALEKLLQNYRPILTTYQGNKVKNGLINVFISGNRPIETLKKSKERLASLDGRPANLGQKLSPSLMPVVSDNYANHLSWRGKGEMPDTQFQKLTQLVQSVHAEGKKLRLWACPEDPIVWQKLREAGADFISTDQLELVRDFLLEKR
ncbi:MAG: phosphatidylinositol-specific phospholipase C/glycerophosphodiester phosphodiesterase family protein [Spirosomataceae bacterium]